MTIQLLIITLLLRTLFDSSSPLFTGLLVAAMIVAASYEVGARQHRKLLGAWHFLVNGTAFSASTILIAAFALRTLSKRDLPQFVWKPA